MANILIIHGTNGNPQENWIPWLKSELEKLGQIVTVPQFPDGERENLQSWFEEQNKYPINKETILVGHSKGATFILSILEQLSHPVKGSILVAGFTGKLNLSQFDLLNKTFAEKEFDWEKIKQNAGKIIIFHSDTDPYIPLPNAQAIADHLDTQLIMVPKSGHFNEAAGFTKFPLLLEQIKNLL